MEYLEKVIGDRYNTIEKEYNDLFRQYQAIKESDKYADNYKQESRDYYIKEVIKMKETKQDELLEELGQLKEKAKEQEDNKPQLNTDEKILLELKKNNDLLQAQALVKGANHIELKALMEEYKDKTEVLNIIKGATQDNISNKKDIAENQAITRAIDTQIDKNKENKLVAEIESYENIVRKQLIDKDIIYLGIGGTKGLGLNIKEQFDYYLEEQDKFFKEEPTIL